MDNNAFEFYVYSKCRTSSGVTTPVLAQTFPFLPNSFNATCQYIVMDSSCLLPSDRRTKKRGKNRRSHALDIVLDIFWTTILFFSFLFFTIVPRSRSPTALVGCLPDRRKRNQLYDALRALEGLNSFLRTRTAITAVAIRQISVP